MSDTIQRVNWHLEFGCPFRQGEARDNFVPAWNAVAGLQAIQSAVDTGDMYGDVCVAGVSYSSKGKSPVGFLIHDYVRPAGGLDEALHLCRHCPANASTAHPKGLAGCVGFIGIGDEMDADGLEPYFRSAIDRANLKQQFAGAFLATTPIWYGLWSSSPLSRTQIQILKSILPRELGLLRDVQDFLRACDVADQHCVPLHVQLMPLGHVDMGWTTTFPHCPRCKRFFGERWEKHYTAHPVTCVACGERYIPADTAMSVPDEGDAVTYDDLESRLTLQQLDLLHQQWRERHNGDPPHWLEDLLGS